MNKQDYLLSVIIPVFNNALFVGSTLRSIFEQIDGLVEVIIINDGSTDNTAGVIRQVLAEFGNPANVIYLEQSNKGVSASRNHGLSQASGRYIAFVDGDDLWSSRFWQVIKPLLQENYSDLIDFCYEKFEGMPPVEQQTPYQGINKHLHSSQPEQLCRVFTLSHWHVWSRVYRRDLVIGHAFIEGRRYEDMMFTPYFYMKARNITQVDAVLYYYRDNPNGITRNTQPSDIGDIVYAMQCILHYAENDATPKVNALLISPMLINCFNEIRQLHMKMYGFYNYDAQIIQTFTASSKYIPFSKMTLKNKLHISYPLLWKKLSFIRAKLRG